jgi:hypothetical protein
MNLKISKRHIVTLWHETQVGNIHTCREKQLEFSDMMWKLYEDMQDEVFDVKKSLKNLTTFDVDKDCDKYHEEQDHKAMSKEKK